MIHQPAKAWTEAPIADVIVYSCAVRARSFALMPFDARHSADWWKVREESADAIKAEQERVAAYQQRAKEAPEAG
jgi:hypothetical protein